MRFSHLATGASGLLDLVYPPRCFACSEPTDQPHGLCGACWAEASFISGTACDTCGLPLPGEATGPLTCDACITYPPPWQKGRAALLYEGSGKRLAVTFKSSDRTDMAKPLSAWMARAGHELLAESDLLVPVPLHWLRLLKRGFNQSALLAQALARRHEGLTCAPGLLHRQRATPTQDGRNREARFANLADAIRVAPAYRSAVAGKRITLVDDVYTTGATLTACTSALMGAGAARVYVLALARVSRDI